MKIGKMKVPSDNRVIQNHVHVRSSCQQNHVQLSFYSTIHFFKTFIYYLFSSADGLSRRSWNTNRWSWFFSLRHDPGPFQQRGQGIR